MAREKSKALTPREKKKKAETISADARTNRRRHLILV
jgi:hypothetical protein